MKLNDGLYQVTEGTICAGFVVLDGKVRICAPVLQKRIEYWKTVAKCITRFRRKCYEG